MPELEEIEEPVKFKAKLAGEARLPADKFFQDRFDRGSTVAGMECEGICSGFKRLGDDIIFSYPEGDVILPSRYFDWFILKAEEERDSDRSLGYEPS